MMPRLSGLLLLTLCLQQPAAGHEFLVDDLLIVHPSIPATSLHATSAPIHMILSNLGSSPERLLAIETPAGTVTFQKPVTLPEGGVRQEQVPYIDIPPGDVVALLPGQLRGLLDGLNRPLFEGTNLPGFLVFEGRGRYEMFFMVDALPDLSSEPGSPASDGTPPIERTRDLWQLNTVLRDALRGGDDLTIAPMVIVGDVAVVGWSRGNEGARTLLRKDPESGWYVELMSDESLLLPASLARHGVRGRQSDALRAEVRAAEAALGPTFTRKFDAYPGTAFFGRAGAVQPDSTP